jgi:hypothetical protein
MHGSPSHAPLWIRVFGAPILLGAAVLIGLLAALLWGALGRYVAWGTVGAPVAVILWAWLRRGTRKS